MDVQGSDNKGVKGGKTLSEAPRTQGNRPHSWRTAKVYAKDDVPYQLHFDAIAPTVVSFTLRVSKRIRWDHDTQIPFLRATRLFYRPLYLGAILVCGLCDFVFQDLPPVDILTMSFFYGCCVFMVLSSTIGASRASICEELLLQLEHKAISDLTVFWNMKRAINVAHPEIFTATMGNPMDTSLQSLKTTRCVSSTGSDANLKWEYTKGEREAATYDTVGDTSTGSDENLKWEYTKGDGEAATCDTVGSRDFFNSIVAPTWGALATTFFSVIVWASICAGHTGTIGRVYSTILAFSFTTLVLGDFLYTWIMLFRWINVCKHSIHCWGYSVFELVDSMTYTGPVDYETTLEFRMKLDALHDMAYLPLCVLNQKLSTPLTCVILAMAFALISQIVWIYSPSNSNVAASVGFSVCVFTIIIAIFFVSGQITESFIIAKDAMKRPRFIASLKPLLGDSEQAEMLLKWYIFDKDQGFKLLGNLFSHFTALGVLATLMLGLLFSFGPSIAGAMGL